MFLKKMLFQVTELNWTSQLFVLVTNVKTP